MRPQIPYGATAFFAKTPFREQQLQLSDGSLHDDAFRLAGLSCDAAAVVFAWTGIKDCVHAVPSLAYERDGTTGDRRVQQISAGYRLLCLPRLRLQALRVRNPMHTAMTSLLMSFLPASHAS